MNELIVYASPTGAFADACLRFWSDLADAGASTTAQDFPPHCTLTGFFHRSPEGVEQVVDDLAASAPDHLCVTAWRLQSIGNWVGVTLWSPDIARATRRFVDRHVVEESGDSLRPKSWFHLSLAYGHGFDVAAHRARADELFVGVTPKTWTLDLWSRRGRTWSRLVSFGDGVR